MAKKIAFGSNHVVIDLPFGKTVKVHRLKDAEILKEKFERLAKQFKIKIKVLIHKTDQPAGRGIGPVLETRDALRVLQQKEDRPIDLEIRSLNLAGSLLDLCLFDSPEPLQKKIRSWYKNGIHWATDILQSGKAHEKMNQIIVAQGGKRNIDSEDLQPGRNSYKDLAEKRGEVTDINSLHVTAITRLLGAPKDKKAGIYLYKKIGEKVGKGEALYTLYSENMYNLKEAKNALTTFPLLTY